MPRLVRPSKSIASLLVALAALILVWILSQSRLFSTLELKTVDARFRALGDQGTASDDIVLISIDDASIKSLEPAVGRWPWPRDAHAVLLSFLERSGVQLAVFDLLFTERDAQYPEGDAAFASAACEAANTVQAIHLGQQDVGESSEDLVERISIPLVGGFDTFPEADPPISVLAECAVGLGHVTTVLDRDGPWRRYLLMAGHNDRLLPSLALAASLAAQGDSTEDLRVVDRTVVAGDLDLPLDTDWRLPIWFNGGPGTYKRYSYAELFYSELQLREGVEPGIDPSLLEGKIAVVGLTAAGLHDLFTTPYSGGRDDRIDGLGKMHGFEVHANVLDNLLNRRVLLQAPAWQKWGLVVLVAGLAALLTLYAPIGAGSGRTDTDSGSLSTFCLLRLQAPLSASDCGGARLLGCGPDPRIRLPVLDRIG